jgi:hypothetical protein
MKMTLVSIQPGPFAEGDDYESYMARQIILMERGGQGKKSVSRSFSRDDDRSVFRDGDR